MAKLGDIFTITSGGTPDKKKSSYYTNGTIAWVKTGDLKERYVPADVERISEEGLNNSAAKLFPANTVLVAMYGATIGACSILPYEAATNQACAAFLPNEKVLPTYLYYFLTSKKEKFVQDGVGGAQPNISAGYLKNVEFDVVSIEKQLEIVAKLNRVYELIVLRKEQLAKLDELVKARFVEMFGDPASNPMGWPKMSMRQAIDKGIIEKPLDGNHGEKHPRTSDYVSAGIPFIMANNLVDGSVDLENCAFITKEQADSLDKGFAHDGDVLLTHKGTIGRTAVLHTTYPYIMLTPQVTYYRPIHSLIPEFLKGYFDTEYFQGIIGNIASIGSTRAYIGITAQQELPLIVPPIEKQKSYAIFFEQTNKTKLTIQASLDKLEVMKKALMQEYFG